MIGHDGTWDFGRMVKIDLWWQCLFMNLWFYTCKQTYTIDAFNDDES